MKQAVIYQIKCIINDKVYIGSSIDLKNRWKCHRHHLRAGTHHSITLQLAWKTYGESKFIISTLESCSVQEQYAREKHWIDKMQAASIEHGFNICPNPKTREGLPHTAETKAKISLSNKGKKKTAEHIRRIVEKNRGRVVSDETRQKLSEAAKGRKWTDEQRASVRDYDFLTNQQLGGPSTRGQHPDCTWQGHSTLNARMHLEWSRTVKHRKMSGWGLLTAVRHHLSGGVDRTRRV